MAPEEKKTIRDIQIKHKTSKDGGRSFSFYAPGGGIREDIEPVVSSTDRDITPPREKRKRGLLFYAGIPLLAVVAIIIAFTYFFASATLTVTPLSAKAPLQDSFVFSADEKALQKITVQVEGEKKLARTVINKVEKKASGTITIYNIYDNKSQRLVKNTRFETEDGKIYRIDSSVVVPPMRVVQGEKIPGTVDAVAHADTVGEAYNIGPSKFTIPGFKGTPKYTGYYGESKESMTGGASKDKLVVAEEDFKKAAAEIDAKLNADIKNSLMAKVPDGFILYDNGIHYSFGGNENEVNQNDSLPYKRTAVATAYVFSKDALARLIAAKVLEKYNNEPVNIKNLANLTFAYGREPDFVKDDSVSVLLTGTAEVVWIPDTKKFIENVAGKPKSIVPSIMNTFPSIKEVKVSLVPFWKSDFPEDVSDIKAVVE